MIIPHFHTEFSNGSYPRQNNCLKSQLSNSVTACLHCASNSGLLAVPHTYQMYFCFRALVLDVFIEWSPLSPDNHMSNSLTCFKSLFICHILKGLTLGIIFKKTAPPSTNSPIPSPALFLHFPQHFSLWHTVYTLPIYYTYCLVLLPH